VIDLTEPIQHLQGLGVSGHPVTRLLDFVWGFEQQRLHLPFGEAAVEIKEGAVLGAAMATVAIGLAILEESLDQRSMQEVGREFKGAQQMSLALA
jgi:hypothetical protein